MKPQQFKQLVNYSAMAGAFVLMSKDANAQVIYHDIDPDEILSLFPSEDFILDFNDDGETDLSLLHYFWADAYCSSSTYGASCTGSTSQRVTAHADGVVNNFTSITSWYGIDPLNYGDVISDFDNYNSDGFASLFVVEGEWFELIGGGIAYWTSYMEGFWTDQFHKYIGVRFSIDGSYHYGWVEISVIPNDYNITRSVHIHGFAYESTAGSLIHAGDIGGCYPPVPIGTTAITATSGKAKWEAVGSAEHYKLQYRATGALGWTSKIIDAPKNFRKITGLSCNTNYEWQVKALCVDGSETDYSPLQTFTTAVCKLENENAIDEENISIWSFANQIHVSIDEDIQEPVQFILYNETGRNVFSNQISETENTFELNLPDGIYIGTIYSGEKMYSKKIVIQN